MKADALPGKWRETPSPAPVLSAVEGSGEGRGGGFWPWGDGWDASACNTSDPDVEDRLGRTSPVGIYPHGAAACGALGLVGNVWEWCLNRYSGEEYKRLLAQPNPVVDPCGPENGETRALRGGSWNYDRGLARCASRGRGLPGLFDDFVGFRLVCVPMS